MKYDYSPETATQTLLLTTTTKTLHMKRGQWSSSQTTVRVQWKINGSFLLLLIRQFSWFHNILKIIENKCMLCEFPNQRILFTKARSGNGILQSDYRCRRNVQIMIKSPLVQDQRLSRKKTLQLTCLYDHFHPTVCSNYFST